MANSFSLRKFRRSEDCFLISGVIDPEIKNTELYVQMGNLLKRLGCKIEEICAKSKTSNDYDDAKEFLNTYFMENGM